VGEFTDIPCAVCEGIDYPATEVSGTVAHLLEVLQRGGKP
jgi:hypothetical protein